MHPPGDRMDPTLHTQTVTGEAQTFFLISHHHTAGSLILVGLNCSVFLPIVLFLMKMFSFSIRKIWLKKYWSKFHCKLDGAFRVC